jgi:hypothetical protein
MLQRQQLVIIISSSSHLIIATGAGSIERLKFQTLVQQHLLEL